MYIKASIFSQKNGSTHKDGFPGLPFSIPPRFEELIFSLISSKRAVGVRRLLCVLEKNHNDQAGSTQFPPSPLITHHWVFEPIRNWQQFFLHVNQSTSQQICLPLQSQYSSLKATSVTNEKTIWRNMYWVYAISSNPSSQWNHVSMSNFCCMKHILH